MSTATKPVTPTVAAVEGKALKVDCPRCGRREVVATVISKRDEQSLPVFGPDGKKVPDGATVHVCALCGEIVKVVGKAGGKPKAKPAATRKATPAAKRKATPAAKRKAAKAPARKSTPARTGGGKSK